MTLRTKKHKMKNVFIISFLIISRIVFAGDITLAEQLKMIKSRPLLVELPQLNTKYVDELKAKSKGAELNEYMEHFNKFVEDYKKAFTGNWTSNKEISFKTYDEMSAITSQSVSTYAVIRFIENGEHGNGLRSLNSDSKCSEYIYKPKNNTSDVASVKNLNSLKYSTLNLYLSEKQSPVLVCRLPITESEAGVVYAIRQFDFMFELFEKHPERKGGMSGYEVFAHNYYEGELNLPRVKTSILYVKKEDLDGDFDIEKISKYYKYEYKIVTNDEWEKAILEKNPKIICAILLPGNINSMRYYHYFFCADNGRFILNMPGMVGIKGDDFKILSKMAK